MNYIVCIAAHRRFGTMIVQRMLPGMVIFGAVIWPLIYDHYSPGFWIVAHVYSGVAVELPRFVEGGNR